MPKKNYKRGICCGIAFFTGIMISGVFLTNSSVTSTLVNALIGGFVSFFVSSSTILDRN